MTHHANETRPWRREVKQVPNSIPFSLRVPKELLERLKKLAKRNKRSANRELEQILEEYLLRWEEQNGAL